MKNQLTEGKEAAQGLIGCCLFHFLLRLANVEPCLIAKMMVLDSLYNHGIGYLGFTYR